MGKRLTAILFFLATLVSLPRCLAENPIFEILMSRGVSVGPGEVVRLPAPTLPDGLNAAGQRKAIEAISESGHSWEDLTRKSVVAPFVLKITRDDDQRQGLGRRLDLWFVAYGDLKTLGNNEFLESQFKSVASHSDPDNGSSMKVLTESDLAHRGLASGKSNEVDFTATQFSLLERVRLSTTTCGAKTSTNESTVSASFLDRRFADNPEFPNHWRPITRDEAGRRTLGSPQRYAGYGGYAKATRLIEPAGAILVEYHVAFAEPKEWFGGTNLLRSKLPIVAQYVVRAIRRSLEKQ